MSSRAGVDQVDRGLAVFDPAGGAGVLPLGPDRTIAPLQVPGLVCDEHTAGGAEVLHDVAAQVVAGAARSRCCIAFGDA